CAVQRAGASKVGSCSRIAPVPEDEAAIMKQPRLPHEVRFAFETAERYMRERQIDVGLSEGREHRKPDRLRPREVGSTQAGACTVDLAKRRPNVSAIRVDAREQPSRKGGAGRQVRTLGDTDR